MKTKTAFMAAVAILLAVPLVAANVNGFENFVLSRSDFKSNPSSVIADFSSRTRTEGNAALQYFSSRKPTGFILKLR